jgi:DNA-binding MarR family transcriptional regulator
MDDASPAGLDGPTIALVTLAREAELRLAALLEPHGLTVRRLRALGAIAGQPGLSVGAVGRAIDVPAEAVPVIVRSLTAAGLTRQGRDQQLTATPAGTELLARLERAVAELDAELFERVERQELAAALRTATRRAQRPPED